MMTTNNALRKVLKRLHFPLDVMLTCVRWYVAYPLSLRHIEEMIDIRLVRSLPTLCGIRTAQDRVAKLPHV
jgi:transposase-like protein